MAFGDVGGVVTELIITCRTPAKGPVHIEKGDAVSLSGPYTVTNESRRNAPVFGQALAAATENDVAIPVKVRGICTFRYAGPIPRVNGFAGVIASGDSGTVRGARWVGENCEEIESASRGVNVKVDEAASLVDVLM